MRSSLGAQMIKTVALVGNPNCGKSTLFNILTGSSQRVGNWPGVTVERKSGKFSSDPSIELIDLPGIYALTGLVSEMAMDEQIACDFIWNKKADVIINIVDATHLERHLYLTTQLIELGIPFVLALNMMDVALTRQLMIDSKKLSLALGCPVIEMSAKKGSGLKELTRMLKKELTPSDKTIPYPPSIETAIQHLQSTQSLSKIEAIRSLEKSGVEIEGEEADILLADARYQFIQTILKSCTSDVQLSTTWTERIDRIVLNRLLGLPIFFSIMYLLFVFAINVGGAFQDFFDMATQTIFVDGLAYLLSLISTPTWLIAILANGLGKGVNTTVTFIPVIGAMFLFLALLEDVGYMARAAFVVDRLMRFLGLPGKAFIPMIVGFGCNVPAIMGARTLQSKGDRILTIMMSPFMSCGARLAIFAVFTAAFFKQGGQNIIFALYLIGIGMAVLTGFILRKTLLAGDASSLIMELPPYHVPHFSSLFLLAWQRLRGFVFRAGKLIIPICVLIGALNTLNVDGSLGDGDTQSLLSILGQWITPVFSPMGIHADNWPATVGLVTGVLAKEVVVGTLNTLYTQMGHLAGANPDAFSFWGGLSAAWQSIFTNFAELGSALSNPVLAKAPINAVNDGVYGLMAKQFDGKIGAFSYLLFVLLYFPCISTLAVMLKELHRGWSIFAACWMTGVAYGAAVFFYQAATFSRHPIASCLWLVIISFVFFAALFLMRLYANKMNPLSTKKCMVGEIS